MLNGMWGRKIGMTQIFSKENVLIPVTVVDLDHWLITGIKTNERDGYDAIQVGNVRERYKDQAFSKEWLRTPKKYFETLREITFEGQPEIPFEIGQTVNPTLLGEAGRYVHVMGITKGRGFQGVVKRHGFSGGRASHGPRFGRWPGSLGFMRSQGKVIKGKRLPGHMGVDQRVMRNSEIIEVKGDAKIALIKGSVPGGSGSLIFLQKA